MADPGIYFLIAGWLNTTLDPCFLLFSLSLTSFPIPLYRICLTMIISASFLGLACFLASVSATPLVPSQFYERASSNNTEPIVAGSNITARMLSFHAGRKSRSNCHS